MKFIINDHGNVTKITGAGYEIDAVSGFISLTEEDKSYENNVSYGIINIIHDILQLKDENNKLQNENERITKEMKELRFDNKYYVERDKITDRIIEEKHEHIKVLNDRINTSYTENERITKELRELCKENMVLKIRSHLFDESDGSDIGFTHMLPCTYSDIAKEMLKWIDRELKNGTDYATKIFNTESKKDILSITFCKVPVKSEEGNKDE